MAFLVIALGFIACSYLLSGLFNDFKSIEIFLVGGILVAGITLILWFSLSIPVSTLELRAVEAFYRFKKRPIVPPQIIKVMCLMAITSFFLVCGIFYFRLGIHSDQDLLQFLRIAFTGIFILGLAVTLLSIVLPMMGCCDP
jgi:hypothetical protein